MFFRVTTSTADILNQLNEIVAGRAEIDQSYGKNEPVRLTGNFFSLYSDHGFISQRMKEMTNSSDFLNATFSEDFCTIYYDYECVFIS